MLDWADLGRVRVWSRDCPFGNNSTLRTEHELPSHIADIFNKSPKLHTVMTKVYDSSVIVDINHKIC